MSVDLHDDNNSAGTLDAPPPMSVDLHDDDNSAGTLDVPPPMSVDRHDDDNSAGMLDVPPTMSMSMDDESDSSSGGTPAGILDIPPTPPMDGQDDSSRGGILDIAPAPPTDEQDDQVPAGTFDMPSAPPMDEQDDSRPVGILHVNRDPAPDPEPLQDTPSTPVEEPVSQPAPTDDAGPAGPSPERDPEELIQGLIEAINSGNADIIRKFVEEEYSESALADGGVDQRVDVYMSVHEEGGECRVVSFDTSSDGDIVALVQSRLSLARQRMQIVREQSPPRKILLVNIDEV